MVSLLEAYGTLYISVFMPQKSVLLLFKITQTSTRLSHHIKIPSDESSNHEYGISVVDNLLYVTLLN